MKIGRVKKVFMSVVLIALLLFNACGKSSETTSDNVENKTIPQNAVSVDPFGKYEPAINVETVLGYDQNQCKFKNGDSAENNIYTRLYADKLGIKLKYRWVTSSAQVTEKTNLMIASGSLPDIFPVNRQQFEQLYKAGKIADLTQAYEQYSSPYTKKYLTGEFSRALDIVKKDGKVYAMPWYADYHETSNVIWLRSDWLKNLNMQVPKTASELLKVAEAFTTQDPDDDGKPDTYGIAMDKDGLLPAYWNMFHSYPKIWIKDNTGKLVDGMHGSTEQVNATKTALITLQDLYKKGVINKEFGIMDSEKRNEDVISSKCGIMFGDLWNGWWPLPGNIDKDSKAEWISIPVPSIDNKPALMSTDPVSIIGLYVVNKNFKNPEALVKMMNIYHNLNNNTETMQFTKYNTEPDGNQIFMASPVEVYNPTFNLEGWKIIKDTEEGKSDPSKLPECYKLFYDQIRAYFDKGDRKSWCYVSSYDKDGSLAVANYYLTNNLFMLNEFTGVPTNSMIKKNPLIDKAWLETMTQIVMGADISKYDKFLKQYKIIGGDDISKEVNDWYKGQNK